MEGMATLRPGERCVPQSPGSSSGSPEKGPGAPRGPEKGPGAAHGGEEGGEEGGEGEKKKELPHGSNVPAILCKLLQEKEEEAEEEEEGKEEGEGEDEGSDEEEDTPAGRFLRLRAGIARYNAAISPPRCGGAARTAGTRTLPVDPFPPGTPRARRRKRPFAWTPAKRVRSPPPEAKERRRKMMEEEEEGGVTLLRGR